MPIRYDYSDLNVVTIARVPGARNAGRSRQANSFADSVSSLSGATRSCFSVEVLSR